MLFVFSPNAHSFSTLRISLVPLPAWPPLTGEHEQQEEGQVPQAAEEQFPGALPVCIHIELEAEVGNVQVDGQRDDREGPRSDVQDWGSHR